MRSWNKSSSEIVDFTLRANVGYRLHCIELKDERAPFPRI